ncbi:MAG TPA: hydroxyacid dehydrogenase [Aliidongia sp.]|nr:hydroxyacid dehydrogenase [Aliidongia sp.]
MPQRFRVLVTGAGLVPEAAQKLADGGAEIETLTGKVTEATLLDAAARGVDAILMRGNPPIARAVIAAMPQLRVIAKHGAGVDSVDLAAATEAGVLVMIAADSNAAAVAEHTIALIMALGRDLLPLDARTKAGHWDRISYVGREIAGRTLGLVGFGRIGRRVGFVARVLGMRVVALPRRPGSVDPDLAEEMPDLGTLLRSADIVSLHLPLTEETRGLIDARALSLMKPDALLVNTARGGLVDEAALASALQAGRIAGAALDNLAEEPPAPDCPLLTAPNLLLTPHIAGMTKAAMVRMGTIAADNIIDVLTGRSLSLANIVNRDALKERTAS